jgi:hypothetical protein
MSDLTKALIKSAESHKGTDLGGLLQWAALHIESQDEALAALREENADAINRIGQQDDTLRGLADVFHHAAMLARKEITLDAFGAGIIDKAPFKNIMSVMYGRDSVGAPLPKKRTRI